jgi:spermidine/putrescine transport system substrate-binding protein
MDNKSDRPIRILAPHSFREQLSRRAFLRAGTATAGLAVVLAACGNSGSVSDGTSPSDTSGGGGDWTELPGTATGEWSRKIQKSSGALAMYTWGDYNDPALVGALADSTLGVTMKVDYYASNEDLITKLAASSGKSGFDIVVPTGPYVPQMIQKGLLQKLDKSLLPNFVNLDTPYVAQPWDPNDEYVVCKDWGSAGFLYDTSKIKRDLTTWADFLDACANEASGNCSVIDAAWDFCGPYFWANGKSANTTDAADLDACEEFMVNTLGKHIKAFDSYPSTKIAEGAYSISVAWTGDARQAYSRIADAGGTPENWKWVLPGPKTQLFMDTYAIPTGAPNPAAAHAWINWELVPEISIQDLSYHGYHTGMKNMEQLLKELAPDLEKPDMIFFSDEQVATMEAQEMNSALERLVDILNKTKAKAGA